MKTMRYILFTITLLISVAATAVEYGRPYRPATPVFTTGIAQDHFSTGFDDRRNASSLMQSGSVYSSSINRVGARMSLYGNFSTSDNGNAGGNTGGNARRGARKAKPGYEGGNEGDTVDDEGGKWVWDENSWDWIWVPGADPAVGATKVIDGVTYRWNGYSWESLTDNGEVGQPIGDTPWLLLLLLCGSYAAFLALRRREA